MAVPVLKDADFFIALNLHLIREEAKWIIHLLKEFAKKYPADEFCLRDLDFRVMRYNQMPISSDSCKIMLYTNFISHKRFGCLSVPK